MILGTSHLLAFVVAVYLGRSVATAILEWRHTLFMARSPHVDMEEAVRVQNERDPF